MGDVSIDKRHSERHVRPSTLHSSGHVSCVYVYPHYGIAPVDARLGSSAALTLAMSGGSSRVFFCAYFMWSTVTRGDWKPPHTEAMLYYLIHFYSAVRKTHQEPKMTPKQWSVKWFCNGEAVTVCIIN